ncbi:FmdB family zinc ribbon protein [Arsenicicoccus sp. oral taxon 190]|uniref:FmdB family zinc ribbon protein n=1 Tax=Arsenicicoccus sp. oral taxon 190 TaxID=1658671 RepID=UPI0009E237CE|nr:FmdB family zinc ribbon protein [Arsenicicoccus sp. oral taxon 190]
MPTYSYRCTSCDEAFDIVQSFSDDSLTVCPACEGRLRKVFNSVGVVFKGSGFYRTDSRGKGTGAGSGAGTAAQTTSSSTSDSASSSTSSSSSSSSSSSTGSATSSSSAPAGSASA